MKKKKYIISLIFKLAIFVLALMGSADCFQVRIVSLGGDGKPLGLFFTSWTTWLITLSIFVSIILNVLVIFGKRKCIYSKPFIALKLMADTMGIVTFIIAAFVVEDKIWMKSYWTYGWTIKHFLLPILNVVDSVLFFDGKIGKFEPLLSGIPMILYGLYMIPRLLIYRSKCGGHIPEIDWPNYYPYGFTNIDKNGGNSIIMFVFIIGLSLAMVIIGYIYYLINKKKTRKD